MNPTPTILEIGAKYGSLTTVFGPISTRKGIVYECICICGEKTKTRASRLKHGETLSCGCISRHKKRPSITKHGYGQQKIYWTWRDMIRRCREKNHPSYGCYGAKGITVCKRWEKVENFVEDMGPLLPGMTIDRINGRKGYSKSNCRWATRAQQQENRCCTVWLNLHGKRISLAAASRLNGIKRPTIHRRIKAGWPVEKAVSHPVILSQTRKISP